MLPNRLKQARMAKGLTQEAVADYLGYTRPTYTAYESGRRKPDTDTLSKLAEFFDTSADYLLGRTDIKKSPDTIAAHHDGNDWTEEELEDIEKFKNYVRMRRDKKE